MADMGVAHVRVRQQLPVELQTSGAAAQRGSLGSPSDQSRRPRVSSRRAPQEPRRQLCVRAKAGSSGLTRRELGAGAVSLVAFTSPPPFAEAAEPPLMAPPSVEELDQSDVATAEAIPMKPLRAVLFDVDGTLADSDPLHFLAFQDMLQELGFNGGLPITEQFFKERISGRHNPDITADLFPDWDEARREKFTEEKEARFRKMALTRIVPVPGIKEFCDWVAGQGLMRAAVTNAPRANAEQMIAGLGLGEFFQELMIGAECKRAKPFPDPYQEAMAALGVSPEECFACEDSPAGIRSALAAQLPTVGIMTGQTEATLLNIGVSVAVTDYTQPQFWDFVRKRAEVGKEAEAAVA